MKLRFRVFLLNFLTIACCTTFNAFAQEETSLLEDVNGDGVVSYLGFGDSITFGVEDTQFPEGYGYVGRLGALLGLSADNEGEPGEEVVPNGQFRFPEVVGKSTADVVSIMEGSNDAIKRTDSGEVRAAYQRIINISRALGKKTIIMTLPPGSADHIASAPFTDSYSLVALDVAGVNDVRVADFQKAWQTTCDDITECNLYNLPSGLHPNGTGYTVMAQTLAATILGIDIFAADGASNLESALGLEPGTVIVKPSAANVSPTPTPAAGE